MTSTPGPTDRSTRQEFAHQAELPPSGLVSELWGLTRDHKKWWLTPIIVGTADYRPAGDVEWHGRGALHLCLVLVRRVPRT